MKQEKKVWCKRSKPFKRTKAIDPSFPSAKYIQTTSGLNRRQACVLHIPAQATYHLFRIKKATRLTAHTAQISPRAQTTSSSMTASTHYTDKTSHFSQAENLLHKLPPVQPVTQTSNDGTPWPFAQETAPPLQIAFPQRVSYVEYCKVGAMMSAMVFPTIGILRTMSITPEDSSTSTVISARD